MGKKHKDYEYEEIYDKEVLGEETVEDSIERIRGSGKPYRYVVKTIQAGDYLESEVYPVYERRRDTPRGKREKHSRLVQKNLNDKNAKKRIVRLVNANFTKEDLMVTLTYRDKYLPTEEQARKDIQNYIRRIKLYRKKAGLPPLKYVYVIEFVPEEEKAKSKKIRIHHHIIMNFMDRNIAEEKWLVGRADAKRLQTDDFGLEGMARYLIKDPKGSKRWCQSKNLTKEKVNRSVSKLTKRKTENMVRNQNDIEQIFESMYKGKYKFNDCQIFYSDIVGGFYLYTRMRKNE